MAKQAPLKRLATTLSVSFENFVSRVENHEAVADRLIADNRAAAARLQMQLRRSRAQATRMHDEIATLRKEADAWTRRAREAAQADAPQDRSARAIACVARLERCEQRIEEIRKRERTQQALNDELERALHTVEDRLREIELKKSELSSRAARAAILCGDATDVPWSDAEAAFERWEESILAGEYAEGTVFAGGSGQDPFQDELAAEFSRTEQEQALQKRLASILETSPSSTSDAQTDAQTVDQAGAKS